MSRATLRKITKWLGYNIFVFGCIIILTAIAVSFSKDYIKSQKLKNEISSLQNDISMNEKKILELSDFLKYLDSDSYAEKKARTDLGLKKPDEKVVIIPEQNDDKTILAKTDNPGAGSESNSIKWWKYFFKKK